MIKNIIKLFLLFMVPISTYGQSHLVNQSGNLVVANGFMVLNNSHFTNNATFSNTDGTVKMMGDAVDANTTIGGSSTTTFKNLKIDKSQNNVALAQNIMVDGQLTLSDGLLDLTNSDLTLLNTANAVVGATSTRYIKTSGTGQLKMTVGSTEETFPVGNSSYNPAKISNTGTSDLLGLRVEDVVKTQLTTGETIQSNIVNRVWQITEGVSGGSDLSINLAWQTAQELTFDRNNIHFSHYGGTKWASKSNGVASGTNPYSFTGTNISTLGAFSLGNQVCNSTSSALLNVVANAGTNQLNICGLMANLAATTTTGGTGIWSFASNPSNSGSIDNLNLASTMLSGAMGGNYTLKWTISGGVCDGVMDEVMIGFNPDIDFTNPDGSLGDGVQDCLDLCLGGDDRVNSDNVGIPDDCDCFPGSSENEFIALDEAAYATFINTEIILGQDTARRIADFDLSSNATVAEKTANYPSVIFKAGHQVTLAPGFHAKAGSDFLAIIEYCRDPLTEAMNNLEEIDPVFASQRVGDTPIKNKAAIQMEVHPNIIHQEAAIKLHLPQSSKVVLSLYNQNGQALKTYLKGVNLEAGNHYFKLDATTLFPGFYFLQLQSVEGIVTQKLIIQQ